MIVLQRALIDTHYAVLKRQMMIRRRDDDASRRNRSLVDCVRRKERAAAREDMGQRGNAVWRHVVRHENGGREIGRNIRNEPAQRVERARRTADNDHGALWSAFLHCKALFPV